MRNHSHDHKESLPNMYEFPVPEYLEEGDYVLMLCECGDYYWKEHKHEA